MRAGTHYTEFVFLHPVRSAGHVVHLVASEARNADALFLMLGWTQCGSRRKRAKTRYVDLVCVASGAISRSRSAFRCVRGAKRRRTIFYA
jgi:hypothetical protein